MGFAVMYDSQHWTQDKNVKSISEYRIQFITNVSPVINSESVMTKKRGTGVVKTIDFKILGRCVVICFCDVLTALTHWFSNTTWH